MPDFGFTSPLAITLLVEATDKAANKAIASVL
jgi:hypothetical protein